MSLYHISWRDTDQVFNIKGEKYKFTQLIPLLSNDTISDQIRDWVKYHKIYNSYKIKCAGFWKPRHLLMNRNICDNIINIFLIRIIVLSTVIENLAKSQFSLDMSELSGDFELSMYVVSIFCFISGYFSRINQTVYSGLVKFDLNVQWSTTVRSGF